MDPGNDNVPFFDKIYKKIPFNLTTFLSVICFILSIALIAIMCRWYYMFPNFLTVCPYEWVGYDGKCYYFSNNETDWRDSKRQCESMNSSLIVLDNKDVINFISKYGKTEYWIEKRNYKNIFFTSHGITLDNDDFCLFFDLNIISLTPCIFHEKWICVKSDNYATWYNKHY
ncbi:C-type lectin protein [Fowlpox virus]|nr:C-type lectin protein [Fowlpox virus]